MVVRNQLSVKLQRYEAYPMLLHVCLYRIHRMCLFSLNNNPNLGNIARSILHKQKSRVSTNITQTTKRNEMKITVKGDEA